MIVSKQKGCSFYSDASDMKDTAQVRAYFQLYDAEVAE
jgi:hypothetical protein